MNGEEEVKIPRDVADLYQLEKEAFVTYEQLTQRWEVNSLARFRDALDHIIMASMSGPGQDCIENLAQAKEHLSEVIAEPFKDAILEQPEIASRKEKWIRLRRLPFSGIPELQSIVSDLRSSCNKKLIEARMLHGSTSPRR